MNTRPAKRWLSKQIGTLTGPAGEAWAHDRVLEHGQTVRAMPHSRHFSRRVSCACGRFWLIR